MTRRKGKMVIKNRIRQKYELRRLIILGSCSIALVIIITVFLNFSGIRKSKANEIDIRQKEEQVFINEMSIPEPHVKYSRKAGPNTIYIQKIK